MPFMGELFAAVVSAGVDYYVARKEASATKKAANQRAALEQQRIDLLETERALTTARETARIRREARGKAADIRARMGVFGLVQSSVRRGGEQAVKSSAARETAFVEKSSELAGEGNKITSQQVELNRATTVKSADQSVKHAAISGIGTVAVEAYKL